MDIPPSNRGGATSSRLSNRSNQLDDATSPKPSRSTSLRQKQGRAASGGGAGDGTSSSSATSSMVGGSSVFASASNVSAAGSRVKSANRKTPRQQRRSRDRHTLALESIRHFLKGRSSYDVLPVSFRLIVLDTKLVVGPALEVMWSAGIVSAPLWQSISAPPSTSSQDPTEPTAEFAEPASAPAATTTTSSEASTDPVAAEKPSSSTSSSPPLSAIPAAKPGFAGMLTVNDIIHLIQYYYRNSSYDSAKREVETFRLERLREIEAALAVPPPPLLSCHPLRPLLEACQLLVKTHARRLPLLDWDEQTGIETVVSVLTQYRVLKFIAMNCRETASLYRSLRSLGVGTFVESYLQSQASAPGSRRGSEQTDSHAGSIPTSDMAAQVSRAFADQVQADLPPSQVTPTADDTPTQELSERESLVAGIRMSSMSSSATPAVASEETSPPLSSTKSQASSKGAPATSSGSTPEARRTSVPSHPSTNPYHPIYTATLDTTVFDVVHMFSERGISAVPILDENGGVVDLYETVDVITLVRSGAYQSLDLTIRQALDRRPADFPGTYCCSPEDSLANIFALLRKRRVHRLVIVEPEETNPTPTPTRGNTSVDPAFDGESLSGDPHQKKPPSPNSPINTPAALEESLELYGPKIRKSRGKLVGILALSDLLRHIIGLTPLPPLPSRRTSGTAVPTAGGGKGGSTMDTPEEVQTSTASPQVSPPAQSSSVPAGASTTHPPPVTTANDLLSKCVEPVETIPEEGGGGGSSSNSALPSTPTSATMMSQETTEGEQVADSTKEEAGNQAS